MGYEEREGERGGAGRRRRKRKERRGAKLRDSQREEGRHTYVGAAS